MPDYKRVVVKIGTSILVDRQKKISPAMFRDLARQVRAVKGTGIDVILVSSGAIASGMESMGLKKKPNEIEKRQALASMGQISLMGRYTEAFEKEGMRVGQILLTHEDPRSRIRCLHLTNTLNALLTMDIVPIVNENDALSFAEIKFGDNDNLSALMAQIADADLLLLLSDVDGLYDKDPFTHTDARMIPVVEKIDKKIEQAAGGSRTEQSTGGMVSKLEAAKKAGAYGIPTRLVLGGIDDIIIKAARGDAIGTLFLPHRRLARKRWWAAYAYEVHGVLWVDDGAERAIREHGKSLLPSGIAKIEGDFLRGECVELKNIVSGGVVARGITNYSSEDVDEIKGLKSVDIEKKLGYKYTEEVINRDNMVVL